MNGSVFIHCITGNATAFRCKFHTFSGCKDSHFITIFEPCVTGIIGTLSVLCHNISIRIKGKFCTIQFYILKNKLLFLLIPAF